MLTRDLTVPILWTALLCIQVFTVGKPHSDHVWTNVVQSSILTRIVEFCVLNVSGLLTDGLFPWVTALCLMQFYLKSGRAYATLAPIILRVGIHSFKTIIAMMQHLPPCQQTLILNDKTRACDAFILVKNAPLLMFKSTHRPFLYS